MNTREFPVYITLLMFLLAAGCSTYKPLKTNRYQREIDQAQQAMTRGDFSSAARIYSDLSKKSPHPAKDRYLRLAAEAYYQANDLKTARETADRINPSHLVVDDRYRLRLLYGRIFLAMNEPENALHQLQPLPGRRLPADLRLDYHSQRARIFAALGNHIESAGEQILAEQLMTRPAEIEQSQSAILSELLQLSKQSLKQLKPSPPNTLSGWMDLTLILKEYPADSPEFNRYLSQWKKKYPRHPADTTRILAMAQNRQQDFLAPAGIGILLPLSGPHGQVGEAVRQGILVAESYRQTSKPALRFYDTSVSTAGAAYQQAVDDGAEIVIGPLKKDNLSVLANQADLPVPVLALNQIGGPGSADVYQFGLNPEDEADAAAQSAWSDGYQKAAIYVPSSSFGRRMSSRFSDKFRELGGEIVEIVTYNSGLSDYGPSLKQLLDIQEDQRTTAEGTAMSIGPGAGFSAEMVFLIALPAQARMIHPLFDYYGAGNIPVYSTSHVYSGNENSPRDKDLSGIVFCDISWLLDSNIPKNPSLASVLSKWHHPATKFIRLMALGFDAYNLLPHVSALQSGQIRDYPGVTGTLSMRSDNRIQRHLECAEFSQGRPVLRNASPARQ